MNPVIVKLLLAAAPILPELIGDVQNTVKALETDTGAQAKVKDLMQGARDVLDLLLKLA